MPVPFSVGNCYLSLRYPDRNCIVDDQGQPIVQPAAASFLLFFTPCFLSILNLEKSGDKRPQACENVLDVSKGENWQLPRYGGSHPCQQSRLAGNESAVIITGLGVVGVDER